MSLPTTTLGRTGETVTKLGYGAMELRSGNLDPSDVDRLLNAVLDAGVNVIDTSPDYGASEEHIGRAISHRRDEFFLCSKCGCPLSVAPETPAPYPHDYTAENVRADVEQSLRRLRTDRLDLVQVHMSPTVEEMRDGGTIEELVALRDEGKIRFLGMSGTLPHIEDHIAMGVFDAFQIPYSALQREHEDVVSRAAAAGAGIIIRGGAARGGPANDKQNVDALSLWDRAGLDDLLDGSSRMEFLLRFTISHPDLHTTIVGTINPDHLKDNVNALLAGPLPADLYGEALAGVGDLLLPAEVPGAKHVWHVYAVRTRDPEALGAFLAERGIDTKRHYPEAPHLAPALAHLGCPAGSFPVAEAVARETISLPLYPGISEEQLHAVVEGVRDFFARG